MYEIKQEKATDHEIEKIEIDEEEPIIIDEICVEELAIDGICGVY